MIKSFKIIFWIVPGYFIITKTIPGSLHSTGTQMQWGTPPEISFWSLAWPVLAEHNSIKIPQIPRQMWQQLVLPQETTLGQIHPRCSSCWLTSPFCLSPWGLRHSKKWGVFGYGGSRGSHVGRGATIWLSPTSRKCVLLEAARWHLEHSPAMLCFAELGPYCQRKRAVSAGSLQSSCACIYHKNSACIFTSLIVTAVVISPFIFFFCFCFCCLILLK